MTEPVEPRTAAYAEASTTPFAGALAAAAQWTGENTAWPQMMSGVPEARLLEALIVAGGARRVVEVGTFTGVGTLVMAAAVGPHGRVTTLEADPENAARAREHFRAAGLEERIDLIEGPALDALHRLDGPWDLAWVDAAKEQYPDYYEALVPKLAPRGVLVADNLLRAGRVLDASADDPGTVAMRAFAERVTADERTHNVLLTVGDGVMLAWPAPGD